MKVPSLLLLLLLAISSSSTAEEANAKALLGVWRGTSTCVNLEAAPACKNEEVIYEFRETTPPVARKLNLKADKIVDGKVVPMGELDLVWVPAEVAWSCEIQTPRVHDMNPAVSLMEQLALLEGHQGVRDLGPREAERVRDAPLRQLNRVRSNRCATVSPNDCGNRSVVICNGRY